MSTRELIDVELTELSEEMQREVYDFVRFLKMQSREEPFKGLLLSQSSLAQDWNTPEEDSAWQNL
jgi:hypothetical protein